MTEERPLVLIVDDDKQASRTMALALDAVGYTTREAASVDEGLQLAQELPPSLIILDYHMEGQDGVTLLRALRKKDWGKAVPVIVASNIYDVDIINDIMSLGVQDYVLKADVNLDEIVKLVGKYVPAGPFAKQ